MGETDSGNSTVCPQCGKTRRESKSGTITGWIFDSSSCRCDALTAQIEKQSSTTPIVCLNCKLPIAHNRKASITQWIFPSGKCSCERPATSFQPSESRKTSPSSSLRPVVVSKLAQDLNANESMKEEDALPADDPKLLELAGSLPDRFAPFQYLGRGAVSVVCAAKDKYLGRVVAVKVFDQGGMDSGELVRFQSEAKIISRLDHPNIVQVFDFGITDSGKPFMVLEYVKGATLRSVLTTNGPLSNDEVLSVFTGVASALAYAHGNGFSHRDLKPENLIIQSVSPAELQVKIIDFGLAKYAHARDAFTTHSGISLIGTPPYMPPDQASGKEFDVRSEIYSFGCVLFESLTGRPPFFADTPLDMIAKHCTEPAPLVIDLNPYADEALSRLTQKCLNKNPAERPQSFEAIISDLDSIWSGSDTATASIESKLPAKRTGSAAPGIVISAIAICSCFVLFWAVLQPKEEKDPNSNSGKPGANSAASGSNPTLGDHVETFSFSDLQSDLKDLNLVSKQSDSDLTPKADEVMLRVVSNVRTIKNADFSGSDLTDKMLSEIGGLDKITELTLDNCKISDVGLEQLVQRSPALSKLSIVSIAQLSERGLKSLGRLHLDELNCSRNHLQDEDIKALSKISARKFILNDTGLSDRNINLFDSKTAESVVARSNKIGMDGLSALLGLPAIKNIVLSPSTNLTKEKIDSLKASLNSSCDVVIKEYRDEKQIKEKAPSHLVTTFSPVRFDPRSKTIDLQGSMTVEDYKKVLNYPQATSLNGYYLTDMNPTGFKFIAKLPLKIVNLGDSEADDKIVDVLAGMQTIQRLVLSKTNISDAGLAKLAALKNLEELEIDTCKITDAGLIGLARSTSLQRLSMKNITQVSQVGIRALCKLPLTNINFMRNTLDEDDMKAASQLNASQYSFRNTGLDDRKVRLFNCRRTLTIDLVENNIGPDGLSAILTLPSLMKVSLSAHPGLTPGKVESIKKAANKTNCLVEIRAVR